MTREELTEYIIEEYRVPSDTPFPGDFDSAVFRHKENRKWFALIMRIGKDKLGIPEEGMVDIVNVKVEPEMTGYLTGSVSIYPAYHMNKTHWVTVLLDGSATDELVKNLVDMSYSLTDKKRKPKNLSEAIL